MISTCTSQYITIEVQNYWKAVHLPIFNITYKLNNSYHKELIFCLQFLTSSLICVCPSKMIHMACELGTFNAYAKKKSPNAVFILFPLPTSNSIISIFNIIVSFIYPIQVRWIKFQSKTLKHFLITYDISSLH